MKGFKGTTYEVLTGDGKRWTIDSTQRVRLKAMKQAETLLATNRYDAVRVTARKDGWSRENVVFEQTATEKPGKALKVTPIEEAAVCADYADYYGFASRRTIGRLIRAYLDEQGITALELLFDAGRLNMLERNEAFFSGAMQRAGGVQAKASGETPTERINALYSMYARIKDRARSAEDLEEYATTLRQRGLDALIEEVKGTVSPENRDVFVAGALALFLGDGRDWGDKLDLVIDLAEAGPTPDALGIVDGIGAEILDGSAAVTEIIGSKRDAISAFRAMVQLAAGRHHPPKFAPPCLARLNDLLADTDMPLTRQALLERVARNLGGIRPLTKEGPTADREAFLTLVRDAIEPAGLIGGPAMSAAVTLRGKMVLGGGEADLSLDQTIEQVLFLFPNRAIRLGFLLDLSQSEVGEKHTKTVLGALMRLVQQLTSVSSLVPAGTPREALVATVDALRERLGLGGLPEDLRKAFAASLDRLLREKSDDDSEPAAAKTFKTDGGTRKMPSEQVERKQAEAGQILFNEGDPGDEAYIVIEGEVEIFRKSGNRETVLATVGRGEVIGEISLIDNQPRMASARTMAGTELIVISREGLKARLDRLEDSDRVLRRLIDVFVERLRGQARTTE